MTHEEKQHFWLLSYADMYIKKCSSYLFLRCNARIGISFEQVSNAHQRFYEAVGDALFEAAITAYGNIFSNHDGIRPTLCKSFSETIKAALPPDLRIIHDEILLVRNTVVCHSEFKLKAQDVKNVSSPALKVVRERKSPDYSVFTTTDPRPSTEHIGRFGSLVECVEKIINNEITPLRQRLSLISPEMNECHLDTSDGPTVWLPGIGPDWVTLSKPEKNKGK